MAQDIIQADFPKLESLANTFDAQSAEVRRIITLNQQSLEKLKAGGWIADAASAFQMQMANEVMPAVQRLANSLTQAQQTMREIARILQTAEEEACGLVNQAVGGDSSLWSMLPPNSDGAWHGVPPSQAQVLVMNGINTKPEGLENLMRMAQQETNQPVMGIYNRTEGTGSDILQAVNDKFQAYWGVRLDSSNAAVQSMMDAVKATNGPLTVMVHSQGGAITAAAMQELSRQGYDLSRIHVITMGSASFAYPSELRVTHRVNVNDVLVPVISGGVGDFLFDPLTLGKTLINPRVDYQFNVAPALSPIDAHGAEHYFKTPRQ